MFSKYTLTNVQLFGFKQIDDSFSFETHVEEKEQSQGQILDLSSNVNFQVEGKITQVAVGQSHALLLNEQEKVQTVGSNQFGQRGDQAVNAFTPSLLDLNGIQQVACGLYHSICLDKQKNVYAWGRGTEGQLGLGEVDFQHEPVKLTLPPISYISCGGSHSLFITQDGEVYVCGDDTWGQLGIGSSHTFKQKPSKIDFGDTKIVSVQGGLEHSIFLTAEGKVFTSGNNLFSQCGLEGTSNLTKPTLVNIPLQMNEFVTNIYASMGTFSAVLTSRSNIYVWGTGSWGHARRPTNIQEICQFDGIPKFSNILMGDNYALIQDIKNYLVFGCNHLPDLGSQQPIQKFKCEPFKLGSFLRIILGYKMLLVLEKEVISSSPNHNKNAETNSSKSCQRPPTAQSVHSNPSIASSPKVADHEAIKKNLIVAQNEIETLKKELEFCKQQMKQKDQLIVQLQDNIDKHQQENAKLTATLKTKEQVQKEGIKTPSREQSKIPSREVSPKPSPRVETKYVNDRRPSISVSKVEPKPPMPTVTCNENYLYIPQPHSQQMSTPQYGGSLYENQKRPYKAQESTYTQPPTDGVRKNSLPLSHNQSTDYYKSTSKTPLPLQPSNTSGLGGGFEYKTYEKLRLLSAVNTSSQDKPEESETRIRKIDEGQFSLSRYNMKSIRSITPYDVRSQTPYQSNTSVSDLKKSTTGNPTSLIVQEQNHFKTYEQYLNIDRAITPECQPQLPEYSHKRTTTLANYRDHYTPLPDHQINTSIIDKICNYQRIMVQKAVPQLRDDRMQSSVKTSYPEQRTEKKSKQSPFGIRSSYANCDYSYVDQFSSIYQDASTNQYDQTQKQEDYFRLRG